MNIFITGGTTGIGLELAREYLKLGHRVGLCGRDLTKLPKDFTSSFHKVNIYQADVSDRLGLKKVIEEFARGGLDLVIANAGIAVGSKKKLPDFERARQVVDINIHGVINTFEPALDFFLKQKKGHLVAIASIAGMNGLPGTSAYSGSKAFVIKYCESLALDLPRYGIDVTAISPGWIETPLTQKNQHPMPFILDLSKATTMIMRAIAAKKSYYALPKPIVFITWLLMILPRRVYLKVMGSKWLNYSKG